MTFDEALPVYRRIIASLSFTARPVAADMGVGG